ncbi:MAG TPA: ABC transporter ATP-binding protein [Symbiobacteriaceae bacterium]|jgi:ABC-2 type transport system ATP-binding protein
MGRGIIAEELTKVYSSQRRQGWFRTVREEKRAVDGLSLSVPPGRVTGLLGLNGAGKTTTIKMLSTLLLPTAGRAEVDGLDLVRDANAIRRKVNMIAGGERMVYWRLTGRENLWYFAQLYDVEPRGLKERIDSLLRSVGLADAADKPVEQYSKGMKQRLQIVRGLINDPTYIFMDEPTLGLDVPVARELRQTVRRLTAEEGKGVLLTSHYLAEVEELCAYIYVVNGGRLEAQGSPADLKRLTRRDRQVKVLLAELPAAVNTALDAVAAESGARIERQPVPEGVLVTVRHQSDLSGRVAGAVALAGASILKLEALEPTLEEAILALADVGKPEVISRAG